MTNETRDGRRGALVLLLTALALLVAACGGGASSGGGDGGGSDSGSRAASRDAFQPSASEPDTSDVQETEETTTTPPSDTASEDEYAAAEETTMPVAEGEQYEQSLDQLPTATAASASASLATVDQQGSLEDYLTYIALEEIDPFWAQVFASTGQTSAQYGDQYSGGSSGYQSAALMISGQPVQTACGGVASDETGSLYCGADNTVYFTTNRELEDAGTYGEFSFAFTIAHEWGHHVQNQLGYFNLSDETNDVAFENQADCFAGVWAYSYYARGGLDDDAVLEGINATYGFGDARSEEEGKDHGSPTERLRWFLTGYDTGDPSQCATFTSEPAS